MESNPVNPQDIVNRAAEVLERDGWTQHAAHRADGTHCLLGAVGLAAAELYNSQMDAFLYSEEHAARLEGQNALDLVAEQIVKDYGVVHQTYSEEEDQDYMDSLAPHERVHIPTWNDSPQRTVEDVLLILKKAGHDG
jgi:hypothetical protein